MATLNISKVGRATSVEGVAVDFTADILREVAGSYDPNLCEAPIVVGHPTLSAPAFGYINTLSFADGKLIGTEDQVDPDFNELRRKGHFKHPSASFFTPSAPNNPTPGKWYLRHVGYLGGVTPALKGLNGKVISFADEVNAGVVTVCTASFADGDLPAHAGSSIAQLFRRLREYFIASDGVEKADQLLPDWEIQSLASLSQRAAEADTYAQPAAAPGLRSFADPASPQEVTTMTDAEQAQLEAARKQAADLQAENQRLLAAQAQAAATARHVDHVSFADGLVEQGRWPAGHKEVLVATLDHLAEPATAGTVSFGDGTAAQPLHQVLREQLASLPVQVPQGEMASKKAGAAAAADEAGAVLSFADQGYSGVEVDGERAALDLRIKQYAAQHQVSYAQAAAVVR